MSAKGGGARKVTDIPGGISDFDLSPDGKRAVVVADVGLRVGSKAENPPPIEIDRFLFKWDGEGYLDDRTQQLFIVDLATGKARQLTSGQRDHWHPVWSPDGMSLAYTAKERGETDRDSNYEIFVQRVDAGEPKKISTVGRSRQRSGLGRASRVVAGLAPRAVAGRRREQVDLLRDARSWRWPTSPAASDASRRASIAGSTIPNSRPTARSSR